MNDSDVLVIGGGITGLACRAALRNSRSVLLLEAAPELGGLLRVTDHSPYHFDTATHVLSLRGGSLRRCLERILPEGLHAFPRSNHIWQQGHVIDYPYQFHGCQLPPGIREECAVAFAHCVQEHRPAPTDRESFGDWLNIQFGGGFYRHFFKPFNEKLYGLSLDRLDAGPMKWTIPAAADVLVRTGFSAPAVLPEATRYYPKGKRGIAALVDSIASLGEGPILCGRQVVKVDPARREVHTKTGDCFRYRQLVSTISLPALVACVTDLPSRSRRLAGGLKAQGIRVARIGCRSSSSSLDGIWTYFPDSDVPFYRMTRLEKISPDLAPPGGAALLFEYPQSITPEEITLSSWLEELGVANVTDVEHFSSIHLPTAYVLFNRGFQSRLNELRNTLSARGILTAGRYGSWRYSDIEMDIQSAIRAAHAAAGVTLTGSVFLEAMKT